MEFDSLMTSVSNWGRWGEQDELGTLNLINPAARASAIRLIREGFVTSCQRTISATPSEVNSPPMQRFMIASGESAPQLGQGEASEWIGLAQHGHNVTHLDSLGHFFWNGRSYNGRAAGDAVSEREGATFGSIEVAAAGLLTPGVLLDLPAHRGLDMLPDEFRITPSDLDACCASSGVSVAAGSALLIRTGRSAVSDGPGFAQRPRPGLDISCVPWLRQHDISILVSDRTHDIYPPIYAQVRTPIHVLCIVGIGLWLIDNADLEPLSRQCSRLGRSEFAFVAAPLRLSGATGSPVNPLAIF
jgi:kynurenine formamidase